MNNYLQPNFMHKLHVKTRLDFKYEYKNKFNL